MQKCLCFFALCLVLCGCFTVDRASSPVLGGDIVEHVVVYNYGWCILGCIPLVCGNENFDSWCPFTFFKDEVRLDLAYAKLEKLAKAKDCEIADLKVIDDRDVIFNAWYADVPWVLNYTEVNISASLVKKGGSR